MKNYKYQLSDKTNKIRLAANIFALLSFIVGIICMLILADISFIILPFICIIISLILHARSYKYSTFFEDVKNFIDDIENRMYNALTLEELKSIYTEFKYEALDENDKNVRLPYESKIRIMFIEMNSRINLLLKLEEQKNNITLKK